MEIAQTVVGTFGIIVGVALVAAMIGQFLDSILPVKSSPYRSKK